MSDEALGRPVTGAQIEMLRKMCADRYGESHPRGQRRRTGASLERRGCVEGLIPSGYRITALGRRIVMANHWEGTGG